MKTSTALILSLILLACCRVAAAETLYVTDELKIAMRSGDTTQHRIIKFIPVGTRLKVLESNDDDTYKKVAMDDGREGWVETRHLSSTPGAREQLAGLESRLAALNDNLKQRRAEISELEASLRAATARNEELERLGEEKSAELEELSRIAARPVQLAQRKQQLEAELEVARSELAFARAQIEELSDTSLKEWFVIGAGVSLLSLFAGLIIPGIRWRKKDSWSGGF